MKNKRIVDYIKSEISKGNVADLNVTDLNVGVRQRSPIPRSLWIQLPSDVRDLLEHRHGYSHFDVEGDYIVSNDTYISETPNI